MVFLKKLVSSLLLLIIIFAFSPYDIDPLDKLVTALQKWSEDNPQEKVHLHMDKPYYALGDTIWFKAYLVTGFHHQLSAISGTLYVDLISEKDSIVKSLKLPVSAGMTMGDFTLEDDLREGNYRIRAYTQWMRNAGEDYFFDRTFPVGTPISEEIFVKSAYKYNTMGNKQLLTTLLNYSNDKGEPIFNKEVKYDIIIDKLSIYSKSVKTDAEGNISIDISNEKQSDLRGAYIRTVIENSKKRKVVKDFPIKAKLIQTDIQFFPEGGYLVNGILSRVAFKVIGIDGIGIAAKGNIIDNDNKEVAQIATLNAGMGSFLINPQGGKKYTAHLSLPDGSQKIVPLPQANNEGYVLSVYQPNNDSILVRINVSPTLLKATDEVPLNVNIIGQIGGETLVASPVKIKKQLTSFWIPKINFPSGIIQFTLFSNLGEPLNERLVFVKNQDMMHLKLSSAKSIYKSKEKIDIELESKDKNDKLVSGNFSVTVIDESKVPIDEINDHTIFTDLLLGSDLKGYIEKPNYYFTNKTDTTDKALDNLMLTQGYRRFIWKKLIPDPNTAYLTNPMFRKEGLGASISGVVKTLNNKVVPNAKITLISTKIGVFETVIADDNGEFSFNGLILTDSTKFTVQATTEKNGTKVEVILNNVPEPLVSKNRNIGDIVTNIPYVMKTYIDNSKKLDDFYERTGQLSRVQKLKEVNISGKKSSDKLNTIQAGINIPEGHADKTVDMTNEKPFANLGIFLRALIPNINFKDFTPESPGPTIYNYPWCYNPMTQTVDPMKVILNGRELRPVEAAGVFDNTTLDPENISKIEVVKDNRALISLLGAPSVMIYTKRDKNSFNPNIANSILKGYSKAKEFYIPRYENLSSEATLPDYRSTIFWSAGIKTYSTGKVNFNYYNADGPGKYKVVVEGISINGELGRQIYRYIIDNNTDKPK